LSVYQFYIIFDLYNCFITRFRAAVSVLVGPCCPALLNYIDVDVHTAVLFGKYNDDELYLYMSSAIKTGCWARVLE